MDPHTFSTTQIPYDILVSIIDELALRNQFEDLSACSQTCRMLLGPCRVHLFATATIARNGPQFAALLNRNPALQVYFRKLAYRPTVLSKDIANAFLLLNNVKTLVLEGCHTNDWRAFTPSMQHALTHLFNSPSLTRVIIYDLSNVPILLLNCSNLMHLDINQAVSFTSDICNTTVLASPKLVSLDISKASWPTVESLFIEKRRADGIPLLDVSDLQSLAVRVRRGPAKEMCLSQVLRSTPKLEQLYLKVIASAQIPDSLVEALTFPFKHALRSLKIECSGYYMPANPGTNPRLPGLFETLRAFTRQPNNINEFHLIIRTPWSNAFTDQDWERVDQVLADQSTFRHLKKLGIRFWTTPDALRRVEGMNVRDELTEFRVTKLPRLSLASNDYLDLQVTLGANDDEGHLIYDLD